MPFIQRIIEPVFVSRPTLTTSSSSPEHSQSLIQRPAESSSCASSSLSSTPQTLKAKSTTTTCDDFGAISNCTLSNILRQLASLVLCADGILGSLGDELQRIQHRTEKIKRRLVGVERSIEEIDETIIYKPNTIKFTDDAFKTKRSIETALFTASTRPKHIQRLYENAVPTPVLVVNAPNNIDDCYLMCLPAFGNVRHKITKKIDAEIETRVPAAIEDLRKWTSSEAIGEITVNPTGLTKISSCSTSTQANTSTVPNECSYASFFTSYTDGIDAVAVSDAVDAPTSSSPPLDEQPIDHKLPSPEEQSASIAKKYPAEMVAVNTSEVRFERMCSIRKSLGHMPSGAKLNYNAKEDAQSSVKRSSRRRSHGKRRNTIGGVDDKTMQEVYSQQRNSMHTNKITADADQSILRSKSNDLLRNDINRDSLRSSNRFNHFRALKQWSRQRLRINGKNYEAKIDEDGDDSVATSSFGTASPIDDKSPPKLRQKSVAEKRLKQNPLYSSSERLFMNLSPKERRAAAADQSVKMRVSMPRRHRRTAHRSDEPNSSSGNWSASSESGRTSVSSEVTMPAKSATSCSSLNHPGVNKTMHQPPSVVNVLTRRKFNVSTSSSITSDETMAHELHTSNSVEMYDDDDSSMYSCDTEGYFTSFHVDSGLKTLKEEEIVTVPALVSTSALSASSLNPSSTEQSLSKTTLSNESDYELFGKGSTSTTASSAGTVCTTLLGRSNGSIGGGSLVDFDNISVATAVHSSPNLHYISDYGKPKALSNISLSSDQEMMTMTAPRPGSTKKPSPKTNGQRRKEAPRATTSDVEFSENSDFENAECTKRIRGKTMMTTNRIPSMCVITPLNSDDEERVVAMESMLSSLNINKMQSKNKTTVQVHGEPSELNDSNDALFSAALSPFRNIEEAIISEVEEEIDAGGEYVTIKDVQSQQKDPISMTSQRVQSNEMNAEYVSLNELPTDVNNTENYRRQAAIKPNANGMFVYDSHSLRYKKSLCSTFKGQIPTRYSTSATGTGDSTDKRTNEIQRSPPFDKQMAVAVDECDDDVYVTLEKRSFANAKGLAALEKAAFSDNNNDAKSSSWPLSSSMTKSIVKSQKKRRFSWEALNILKRIQQKQNVNKSTSPKSTTSASKFGSPMTFKTSTPLKKSPTKDNSQPRPSIHRIDDTSFGNSTAIEPINSSHNQRTMENVGRSTMCSDRMGTAKTSLLDFKKLLLTTSGKRLTQKPSAVEQLKVKRDMAAEQQPTMKILDLSGSPKSFANRRVLRDGNASPFKKINLTSPRSRWKFNQFNKNTISSIPEANVEDDATAEKCIDKPTASSSGTATVLSIHVPETPPTETTKPQDKRKVIETNFSFNENIFLQTEENNFMKGEIKPPNFNVHKTNAKIKAIAPSANETQHIQTTELTNDGETKTLETSF